MDVSKTSFLRRGVEMTLRLCINKGVLVDLDTSYVCPFYFRDVGATSFRRLWRLKYLENVPSTLRTYSPVCCHIVLIDFCFFSRNGWDIIGSRWYSKGKWATQSKICQIWVLQWKYITDCHGSRCHTKIYPKHSFAKPYISNQSVTTERLDLFSLTNRFLAITTEEMWKLLWVKLAPGAITRIVRSGSHARKGFLSERNIWRPS